MAFPKIKVEITRFVDDSPQPGTVECRLVDVHGAEWFFIEKYPIVTLENLDENSLYPQPGVITCRVVETKRVDNRKVFRVNTEKPWAVEATTGEVEFDVFAKQLLEFS